MAAVNSIKFSPVNIEARKKLDLKSGDVVRVWQRIREGDKSRLQAFEGLIIARKHGTEPGATFTVRKISQGIGIERIFPLYSPNIEKIELVRRSNVRRAKLYYIREKAAREIRKKMRQLRHVGEVVLEEKAEIEGGEEKSPSDEATEDKEE